MHFINVYIIFLHYRSMPYSKEKFLISLKVTSTAMQLRELLKEFYGMIFAYDEVTT